MARPSVSAFTLRWWARLPAYQRDADAALDYPLLRYLALLGDSAQAVAGIIEDGPARLGDPATADEGALRWLAALAGVDPTPYTTPAQLRVAIAGADDNRAAGSVRAVLAAVRPLLTGSRTASIAFRDPAAFSYTVRVYEREVPDAGALEAVLEATRPAGLLASVSYAAGQTWGELSERGLTLGDLSAFTNEQIRTAIPGQPIT